MEGTVACAACRSNAVVVAAAAAAGAGAWREPS